MFGFLYSRFPGAREGLVESFSDEAQTMIALGTSAFKSVSERFLNGDIQFKALLHIFQRKREFLDLLKTGEYEYLSTSASSA